MHERGEELGRRVRMQKTDVSFDVIYFFKKKKKKKKKYHKRVYIYFFKRHKLHQSVLFFLGNGDRDC